ncbi:MAG: hypothetical protein QME21_18675 [Anaerolineales bacterium]|nr:hypothetical protein [Anaerolineales bacterium]
MNHTRILKRAWDILWSYRVLWIFGILLALTSGGGSGGNGFSYRGGGNAPTFNLPPDVMRDLRMLGRGMQDWFSRADVGAFIGLGVVLLCLVLILTILSRGVNYVSQTALMRMVDGLEARGEKVSWREGFRLGWSRAAWRLFLLDLLVYLPLGIVFIGLFGCALLPLIVSAAARGEPSGAAVFGTIVLILPLILLAVIVSAAVSLVMNLARRRCVLDEKGVVESLRLGVALLRQRFGDLVIMWLILIGLMIGYSILLIPLVFLLMGVGALVGAGVGAAVYFLLRGLAASTSAILFAIFFGLAPFIATLAIPLTFLEGLRQTYYSTAWTLAYREAIVAQA